ncbi:MAG: short-chain dehydrogenase [Cyclobacteriaceae bacterium]|nr:MAG: short-chain dehydrogenase [Cyclobacteriaceae bacterium]
MKMVSRLFNLEGKVIIVAGGAGQIGFSFCEILTDAGAQVILADLDLELASEKLQILNKSNNITLFKLDVTDELSVKHLFEKVRHQYGSIYGLVNSFHYKGNSRRLDTTSNFFAPLESYPMEAWDAVSDVNLKGTFLMCRESVPYFRENKEGVIVNVSSTYGNVSPNKSIYGETGINSPVSYAATKAGIINLTRYIATHYASDNIRANVLSPGGVYNQQSPGFIENYCRLTPLGRMAEPEDYQGAIVYLMSPGSKYMTGANLVVDGGWTAW